jgi:phage baseplate assembly protein gpV
MAKNLLSDTDYTSGRDNRFSVGSAIGRVSKVEVSEKGANVRVIMPDRLDADDNPLISKPVPVLQIASQAKKSFAVPRIDDNVMMVKLANGTSNYAVIGSFYTSKRPPPVTDPLLDYTEWEGGHIEQRDANEDADVFLTQDFKGGVKTTVKKDIEIKTTDGGKMSMTSDGDMLVKSATGDVNVESPSGAVNIKQKTINLEADTINLKGHVVITGALDHTGEHRTNGHHIDSTGPHAGGAREAELEARVKRLEILLGALEQRLSKEGVLHGD